MLGPIGARLTPLFLRIHKLGLRTGFQVTPNRYDAPLADINKLQKTKEAWAKKSNLPGVSFDLDEQVRNLRRICLPYKEEYAANETYLKAISKYGPEFEYIDAQALHSVIRFFKPKKIIEIGSGISTYCSLAALEINAEDADAKFELICVEPNPSKGLESLERIELIAQNVQGIPVEVLTDLRENDLLFIDSSHTVKPGGDVNYLILEVLPRLNKGVIVHFHDIYLPYDYQRSVLQSFIQWNETSLLRAFLVGNSGVMILFCLSQLHYDKKEDLKGVFPDYNPQPDDNGLGTDVPVSVSAMFDYNISHHFPSSIYIQIQ
jgi:predicted O-methyltransferase YrrM